jgi:hydroxylysine kinase
MATMVARSQPVPAEAAVALALEHYGLESHAARLTGERDENFRLSTADGAEYVLKIAHASEEPAVTGLSTAALVHLQASDPTLPCPRVVRALAGDTQVSFVDGAGRARTARMLTYLPGKLIAATARSARQRQACGRIGARLSNALRAFEHPAAHRAIVWDVRHAAQMRRLLEELADFPRRQTAVDLLERIVPRIESRVPRLRHQVVHNDLNPLNVLVEPADESRVSGVIDFGDLTYTALVADVAVTAAEQIPEDCGDDAGCARASILDVAMAYHDGTPLHEEEFAMLGTLVAARLAANLIVHEWHVHRNPRGGHYAPLSQDFIRARLAIAREVSLEEFRP